METNEDISPTMEVVHRYLSSVCKKHEELTDAAQLQRKCEAMIIQAWKEKKRFVAVRRRCGNTTALLMVAYLLAAQYPDQRIVIAVTNTRTQKECIDMLNFGLPTDRGIDPVSGRGLANSPMPNVSVQPAAFLSDADLILADDVGFTYSKLKKELRGKVVFGVGYPPQDDPTASRDVHIELLCQETIFSDHELRASKIPPVTNWFDHRP